MRTRMYGLTALLAGLLSIAERRPVDAQRRPVQLVSMARCLDVRGGVSSNGRGVQIYDCNGTPAQQWFISGREVRNVMGRCLDVANGISENDRPVRVFDCNGTLAQQWLVRGREIRNVMGRCLDVRGGVSSNGRGVQIYDCNGTPAQQWDRVR
jgi:hypothetical protein